VERFISSSSLVSLVYTRVPQHGELYACQLGLCRLFTDLRHYRPLQLVTRRAIQCYLFHCLCAFKEGHLPRRRKWKNSFFHADSYSCWYCRCVKLIEMIQTYIIAAFLDTDTLPCYLSSANRHASRVSHNTRRRHQDASAE